MGDGPPGQVADEHQRERVIRRPLAFDDRLEYVRIHRPALFNLLSERLDRSGIRVHDQADLTRECLRGEPILKVRLCDLDEPPFVRLSCSKQERRYRGHQAKTQKQVSRQRQPLRSA